MNLDQATKAMGDAERDRLTCSEICIDEALTLLGRRGVNLITDPIMRALQVISGTLHRALTEADGPEVRIERLRRIRDRLTELMPLADTDLRP